MMFVYAILANFIPKKLLAMCLVREIKQNKLPEATPVIELFDKLTK